MVTFISFLFLFGLMWAAMWMFFKFMYPKPPKAFMPKQGDIITPRDCDLCGYPLAEYRGVMEQKPDADMTDEQKAEAAKLSAELSRVEAEVAAAEALEKAGYPDMTRQQKKQAKAAYETLQESLFKNKQAVKQVTTWFFCNYDHQADYHAKHQTTAHQTAGSVSKPTPTSESDV